jgi:hypothetical protein
MFSYQQNPFDMFVEPVNGWFAALKPNPCKGYISLHRTYKEAYDASFDWLMDFKERAE